MGVQSTFSGLETPERIWGFVPPLRFSYQTIGHLVGLTEILGIISASIIGQAIYQRFWLGGIFAIDVATGIGLMAALIHLSLARSAELYRLPQILDPARNFTKIAMVWAFGLLVLTALLFLLKIGGDLSRGSFLTFSIFELPLLLATRSMAAVVVRSKIANQSIAGRAAVVIGDVDELGQLNAANLLHQFGLKEVGRIVLDAANMADDSRRLALEKAVALARQSQAEEFVIAVGWSQNRLLGEIGDALRNSPLPARLLPDRVVRSAIDGRRTDSSISSAITVEMQRAPMTVAERAAKRFVDVILAFLAIFILLPVFAATALAVKLDSAGPIIFRQRRNGFDQHQFSIYKFRTMRVLEDGQEITQARRQDPRVTRVGRLLRRASIDELPQLFNVLKGNMSLVGPRPHALAHDDQYKSVIETYCFRHHVKPGITGWAQINGLRGETAHLERMQRRVEFDIWYINNWSLWLDVFILLKTAFEVLKQEAY
ncbi:undecaprenyl-phosphate glucose phosphotransferase [Methyloferula stellata]|uniref:undecaprenyl-phosphate glucose phosphotransferase n=1 Tax=Methyloferula stellata TaxID=876270 RepID=UPI0003A286D4|nr:undecaprenyl-phosphate glucose phosphotransferase [Methyloferula stellata]